MSGGFTEKADKRGGRREGAGRPKSEGQIRITRALRFTDQEWELIKTSAAKKNMSARAFLCSLVEKDHSP